MRAGSWVSIVAVFLFGVVGGSTVSKLIPLGADVSAALGVSTIRFGWLISLIAVPAALLALPSGIVVDRFGPKRVLIGAAATVFLANAIYVFSHSLIAFELARVLEGAAIVHIYTAGPALLMSTVDGSRRTVAMTVWSAYMPVGTAVGMVIGGVFAGTADWRFGFAIHGALLLTVGSLGLFLPATAAPSGPGPSLSKRILDLRLAYARPRLLLLGLSFLLLVMMGLGVNTVFPGYAARLHHLRMSAASSVVALATLVMAPGSVFTGILLARGLRPRTAFLVIAVFAFVVGALSFLPGPTAPVRFAILALWFMATGAAMAVAISTLPLLAEPERRGAAAALLNQAGAVATFISPPLWLALSASGDWRPLIALLAVGWALTSVCLRLAIGRAQPAAAIAAPSAALPHPTVH